MDVNVFESVRRDPSREELDEAYREARSEASRYPQGSVGQEETDDLVQGGLHIALRGYRRGRVRSFVSCARRGVRFYVGLMRLRSRRERRWLPRETLDERGWNGVAARHGGEEEEPCEGRGIRGLDEARVWVARFRSPGVASRVRLTLSRRCGVRLSLSESRIVASVVAFRMHQWSPSVRDLAKSFGPFRTSEEERTATARVEEAGGKLVSLNVLEVSECGRFVPGVWAARRG